MLFPPNPSSGVPVYRQLIDQVRHAIETGALRAGEQLPGTRKVAEDLVMNPNAVAKAYQELLGAFLPSILVCVLAPTQGHSFLIREGLAQVLFAMIGVSTLYGLFVFLSTVQGELSKAVLGGAVLFQ